MNPINYVSGLLDELQARAREGAKEAEAAVRAELKSAVDAVKQLDVSQLEDDAKNELRAVMTRAEDVLGGAKRTTKAAAAPEKAVPPAAK